MLWGYGCLVSFANRCPVLYKLLIAVDDYYYYTTTTTTTTSIPLDLLLERRPGDLGEQRNAGL